VRRAPAPAKLNLALVVGPPGPEGRHEVTTVLQRIDFGDRVALEPSDGLSVSGFAADTLVSGALRALAAEAGVAPNWAAAIDKQIPPAAGFGGGSSDAATALRLANETLARPLADHDLHRVATSLGADVPFFLQRGPQLGEADGTRLSPLDLPQDYWVLLLLPHATTKVSTAEIYRAFDDRDGAAGYEERRRRLLEGLASVRRPRDLAALPTNDLAASPLAAHLMDLGAFRADVTGAGPAVYGLFVHERDARNAQRLLRRHGRTWLTVPAWYG
jgi:4-diphosphocytidyl-2-C-methyl-D-erythritol kinase